MTEKTFPKDPAAVLDYAFDWSAKWLQSGETIVSYSVAVDAGITKDSDSESSGTVTVWLSGGSVGTSYTVTCQITSSLGRTDERSATINVLDR